MAAGDLFQGCRGGNPHDQRIAGRVHWECLPTVLRAGPYRFFFYSADRDEPLHVHVEREESDAKFWLEPARLERSRGFGRAEIARVQRLVEENAILPEGMA
jgi:hypothetical protein